MACEILSTGTQACLVAGGTWAFGPVFKGHGWFTPGKVALLFQAWMKTGEYRDLARALKIPLNIATGSFSDPRDLDASDLSRVFEEFTERYFGEESALKLAQFAFDSENDQIAQRSGYRQCESCKKATAMILCPECNDKVGE